MYALLLLSKKNYYFFANSSIKTLLNSLFYFIEVSTHFNNLLCIKFDLNAVVLENSIEKKGNNAVEFDHNILCPKIL